VDFGGNWCPDCHREIDNYFHDVENSPLLDALSSWCT